MPSPSLRKRYAAKLTASLVGLAIGLVTQAIIPRGLGPRAYGDFHFLFNFFSNLMPFFSFSTRIGFYTKISQRQNEAGLISFYFQFTGLVVLVLFMFVVCSYITGMSAIFWLGQSMRYVYMVAILSAFIALSEVFTQLADAYGITVSTEIAKIIQKCFGLLIICALFFSHQLNLTSFFFYRYGILFFLSIMIVWIMGRRGHSLPQNWRLSRQQIRNYVREFYAYSHPLFVYALFSMVVGILDQWLLQKFGGSVQQGFFGLSRQIDGACFLFISAMTPLITREFSIAYKHNNIKEISRLFRRYIPMLYSVGAFFGCFVCVQSEKITYIFGGEQFAGAAQTVAIMALYSINQAYGQLSGALFFATGQTRLYRNIGLTFYMLSLPITYVLVAPTELYGLNAGSAGLAIKCLICGFLAVNVQLFYNARLLNLRFINYLGHQILCLVCFLLVAFFASHAMEGIWGPQNEVISFLASGVLYSVAVAALGYFVPAIFGFRREDVTTLVNTVQKIISKK